MATLTRMDGPGAPWNPITIGDTLSIGRSRENGLMIDESSVSRRHARIVRLAQGYQLTDLGSENGTWVRNRRIQEHWLRAGDRIRVGEAVLRFDTEEGDPEPAAEPAPPASSSTAVIVGLLAVALGAGAVILAASLALWYYWPRPAERPAGSAPASARQDCYDVCFRRCRAMGDDSAGPWCNDVACCGRACTPMRGVGDASLSFRECEARLRNSRQ
jgi:hypothetical protein